ncbi:MAG TPA: UDP-N-acetylglucosamine 2-epimerase (non-hydrolyzing) [Patescibacteria group bacterium]|nr:UDP-N-acetylglucosamine 2-epimerase (non-hydrolyzing) [Patescibacteria group bacterium]
MKKICFILGTRPEIIKLSPVVRECQRLAIPFFVLHTNQHYSPDMDSLFFDELGLPRPKYNLGVRESLHGKMVGKMLEGIEEILLKEKPDIVLIQGDTNTVLAGGLAAAKLQIKVGHVEAGLRSYDRTMPEELNRVVVDHVSDYLFCPTEKQRNILLGEGINNDKITITGNTIVDAVQQNIDRASKDKRYTHYSKEQYVLLTLHRPANVDDKRVLQNLINIIQKVSQTLQRKVYFPAHPRTKAALERFQIVTDSTCIVLIEPVQYLEMLVMEKYASLILTDSGGVQEEACILHVPCVTLRNNTERPETVDVGANIVAGTTEKDIVFAVKTMMSSSRLWKNPFGEGKAAEKILKHLRLS